MKKVFIKEHSLIAKLAARVLKTNRVAIVLKKTIYLYNVTAEEFLKNRSWVLHELKHIQQYDLRGTLPFLVHYLLLSLKYGYKNNPYEVEACAAEQETKLIDHYKMIY